MIHFTNANLGSICYAIVRFLKIPFLFVSFRYTVHDFTER